MLPWKKNKKCDPLFRMLIEKSIQVQRYLYICYIGYVKAFDCDKHDKLIDFLERVKIDGKNIGLIRNLYYDQKVAIRIQGEFSE